MNIYKYIKFILKITQPIWIYMMILLVFYTVVMSIEPLIVPKLITNIVEVLKVYSHNPMAVWEGLTKPYVLFVVSLYGFSLITFIASFVDKRIFPFLELKVRAKIFPHVLKTVNLENYNSGQLNKIIDNLVDNVHQMLNLFIKRLLPYFLVIVVAFFQLMYTHKLLGCVFLLWIIMHSIICYISWRLIGHQVNIQAQTHGTISGFIVDTIRSSINIKLFHAYDYTNKKLHELNQVSNQNHEKLIMTTEWLKSLKYIVTTTFQDLIFNLVLIFLWRAGHVSGAMFLSIFFMGGAIIHVVYKFNEKIPELFNFMGKCMLAIDLLYQNTPEPKGLMDVKSFNIVMNDVSYIRPYSNSYLFKNLNIIFKPGQRIYVSGITGVGKTSLLNILAGLIPDYTGHISYNHMDLQTISNSALAHCRTYITSDYHLIQGSILHNLELCKPTLTMEEACDALHKAELDELIPRINDDVMCGKSLSSGQKQRLSLARLFLTNPNLIILDEPFSALDENTAKNILHNIISYFPDAIMVVTDHSKLFGEVATKNLEFSGNGLITINPGV